MALNYMQADNEKAIILSALHNNKCFVKLSTELQDSVFTKYGKLWFPLRDFWLATERIPVVEDYVTVLGDKYQEFVNEFVIADYDYSGSIGYDNYRANILKEYKDRQITEAVEKKDYDRLIEVFYQDYTPNIDEELTRHLDALADNKTGTKTGFEQLDKITRGIGDGHFWVIGAATSYGKTTMALNIVLNYMRQKKKVHFISLEMSHAEILTKLFAMAKKCKQYEYAKNRDMKLEAFIQEYLTVTTKIHSAEAVIGQMYTREADLFVVDFLQNVSSRNKSEYETMDYLAKKLQSTAQKLKKSVLGISQLSNKAVREPNPWTAEFKGAGSLAISSDVSIIITAEVTPDERRELTNEGKPYPNSITVMKNRHGRTGQVDMSFDVFTGIFKEESLDISKRKMSIDDF